MEPTEVIREDTEEETAIVVIGDFDAIAVLKVRPVVEAVLKAKPRKLVFVIDGVSLVDSSGVGIMAKTFRRMKQEGLEFEVRGAHGQPLRVLQILRLDRAFGVEVPFGPNRK